MVAMALCLIPSHAVCRHHSSMSIKYWLTVSAPIVIPVFKLSMLFSHKEGEMGRGGVSISLPQMMAVKDKYKEMQQ